MGLIVLLALALAKPILKVSSSAIIGTNAPSSVALILDNSYSMGYREEGLSRLQQAKKAGIAILDTLKEGDEMAIILMDENPHPIFKAFTYDIPAAKEELRQVELSFRGTEVKKSLEKAYELLSRSDKVNREIYLLTDLQENSWQSMFENNFPAKETGDRREIALYIVSFGQTKADNIFIQGVEIPSTGQAVGLPVELSVKMVNLSSKPVNEILTLTIDKMKRFQQPVVLPSGLPQTVKMSYAFSGAGTHSGKVTIKGDQLSPDDIRYFQIRLEDKIPILCVDGDPSEIPALSESFYLLAALNPAAFPGAEKESVFLPRRIELPELGNEDLPKYRIVILTNVPYLEGANLIKIEEYLKTGGNLLIFLGAKVRAKEYNRWEFLPAPLVELQGYPDKENYFQLSEIDYSHPLFRKFSLPGNGDLTIPKFYQCYSLREKEEESPARVLARFTNGSPAIVERSYGTGKVLMVTTTADADWTNLPLRAVYLPLIHQMTHYLAEKREVSERYYVGDPVRFTSPLSGYRGKLMVTDPAGREFTLIPTPQGSYSAAVFEEAGLPGIYTVSRAGDYSGTDTAFAVNLNTRESFLASVSSDRIRELFGPFPLTLVSNPEKLSTVIKRARQGVQLWPRLLSLALLLFIAELLLSNRFSHPGGTEKQVNERPPGRMLQERISKMLKYILPVLILLTGTPAFAGSNLIKNPGFEESRKDNRNLPCYWEATEEKHVPPEYVAGNVSLIPAGKKGKSLRINLTKIVADGPGLGFISDWIEVNPEKEYELRVDVKSRAPRPIIFAIGYGLENGERKIIYRAQKQLRPQSKDWETFSRMVPSKSGKKRFKKVKWLRVKLYAYNPQGEIYFDNVSLQAKKKDSRGQGF